MPSLNLPGKRFFFRRTNPDPSETNVAGGSVGIVQPFPQENDSLSAAGPVDQQKSLAIISTSPQGSSVFGGQGLPKGPFDPKPIKPEPYNGSRKENKLSWMVGGEAGYGIMVTGTLFSKACVRGGLHVFDYAEYPSLIRGGHNSYAVRVEFEPVFSQVPWVDLLVALDQLSVTQHHREISPNGGLIYESSRVDLSQGGTRGDIKLFPMPLVELAKQAGGDELMKNTVALGASFALVDYDLSILVNLIEEQFAKKEETVEINKRAVQLGFTYIREHFKEVFGWKLTPAQNEKHLFISGNEALVAGALKAGCKFVAAYPMTPMNTILHTMAAKDQEFGLVVKEPEDEISAINMAIGASYTGVRAMTATSGGGFSLMVEGVGLAAETETPLVIAEGMRPGPATGMPTWTEQGDLRFVMHCHQGDFPRIVMAPGDPSDTFYLIGHAFNLAEKYQLAVIFLTDKYLAESHWSVAPFDQTKITIDRGKWVKTEELAVQGRYLRFRFLEDGVTPRVVIGTKGGESMVTSDEHDERGLFEESAVNRKKMVEKRFLKLASAMPELKEPEVIGPADALVTILAWGSTKGPILEAMKLCEKEGIAVSYQQVVYLLPFPTDLINEVFAKAKKTLIIEQNYAGQFDGLVTEMTQKRADYVLLKYDGRPFYPQEIVEHIRAVVDEKVQRRTTIVTKWHDHVAAEERLNDGAV